MELSRGIALFVFCALVLVAPNAIAQDIDDDDEDARAHEIRGTRPAASRAWLPPDRSDEEPVLEPFGGLELTLAPITFTSSLARTSFRARPQSVGLGRTEQFDYRGSAFGLDTPRFWGGEARLAYLRRHLRIGGLFFYAGSSGADAAARSPNAASHAVTDRMTALGGGGELSLVVPLDPVTISVGGVVGARVFSFPTTGYEATQCSPTRRQRRAGITSVPCTVEATSGALFFAQPQARIDVALGEGGWAFLGAYAGIDLVTRGESFGLVLGFRTPHRGLAF